MDTLQPNTRNQKKKYPTPPRKLIEAKVQTFHPPPFCHPLHPLPSTSPPPPTHLPLHPTPSPPRLDASGDLGPQQRLPALPGERPVPRPAGGLLQRPEPPHAAAEGPDGPPEGNLGTDGPASLFFICPFFFWPDGALLEVPFFRVKSRVVSVLLLLH